MKKIRINELARELEVKPGVISTCCPSLGVQEKKTHSSSIDEDVALELRRRLVAEGSIRTAERSNGNAYDNDRESDREPEFEPVAETPLAERPPESSERVTPAAVSARGCGDSGAKAAAAGCFRARARAARTGSTVRARSSRAGSSRSSGGNRRIRASGPHVQASASAFNQRRGDSSAACAIAESTAGPWSGESEYLRYPRGRCRQRLGPAYRAPMGPRQPLPAQPARNAEQRTRRPARPAPDRRSAAFLQRRQQPFPNRPAQMPPTHVVAPGPLPGSLPARFGSRFDAGSSGSRQCSWRTDSSAAPRLLARLLPG